MADTTTSTYQFNTFSGTEMTPYISMTLYEEGDTVGTPLTFNLGLVSGMTVSISSQSKPRGVIGKKTLIGISAGVRIVTGSLVFEVFKESVFEQIKAAVKAEKPTTKFVIFQNGSIIDFKDISDLFSLPPFDIIISAVKENDSTKRMRKVIKNVVLTSNGSAIGLNTLSVQESFDFIASSVVPFENKNV